MSIYLFATFVSFIFNFFLIVPFINFLYKAKLQRQNQQTKDAFNEPTPIFDKLHSHKTGTPVGGGILIVVTTTLLFGFLYSSMPFLISRFMQITHQSWERYELSFFTLIGFAVLGVWDDLMKIFRFKDNQFFGLRMRHKLIIEIILATIISFWLYNDLKIDIIHIPFLGVFKLGLFYIPFATFVIVAFSNAVNITDGLDGLAAGVLMIAISGFG